ncbi:nuclear transport factor 2 family protein [Trujillonella endophytica]|uniref:nuclear transport factor 2 family protein n=1 Tax=Trujillonella endophytica TaxID=673521 RepID=UPI001479E02D|nr:nuclear transport factor 2 family protein [Trujillella endophytica]
MTILERLEAIEDITLLKGRRDRLVDTQDWVALEALHAPDYHGYNGDYPPFTSAAEMIAGVKVIMKDLRTAHHSHTPEITVHSPTTASGIWGMTGISLWQQGDEEHWFLATGHYFETYEKRDRRWLFTSRRLEYVLTKTSPGGIFPPPAPDRTTG